MSASNAESICVTRNSTSARWGSKSNTGQNCHRYNGRGKTRDGRRSNVRHRTSSSEHSLEFRRLLLWGHKLARCCSAADDSQGGSRSHANGNAACLLVRRTRWLAAATTELQLMRGIYATLTQDTRSAVKTRQVPHKSLPWRDDGDSLPDRKSIVGVTHLPARPRAKADMASTRRNRRSRHCASFDGSAAISRFRV